VDHFGDHRPRDRAMAGPVDTYPIPNLFRRSATGG
jgi:hypothetical protein